MTKMRKQLGKTKAILAVICLAMALFACGAAIASSGGDHGGEAGGTHGWMNTDTYRVINFAVLFGVLFFLVRKPAGEALSARIQSIKEDLKDLEAKKEAAKKDLEACNARLSDLQKEADQILADYTKQGEAAKARILQEAESAADRLADQARRQMNSEFDAAKQRLKADILERAIVLGEELITKNISDDDQNRLVSEYLDKVVSQ